MCLPAAVTADGFQIDHWRCAPGALTEPLDCLGLHASVFVVPPSTKPKEPFLWLSTCPPLLDRMHRRPSWARIVGHSRLTQSSEI